jgi:hypothetical protein
MTSRREPLEIQCDAPSYEVVRACGAEFLAPLDVRWYRMGPFLGEQATRRESFLGHALKTLLGIGHVTNPRCTCGHALPVLEQYKITFLGETEGEYFLGQCPRCLTMFWETL